MTRRSWCGAAVLLTACAGTDPLSEAVPTRAAEAEPNAEAVPALGCRALTADALGLTNVKITRAEEVAESAGAAADPAHCILAGAIDSRTGIDGQPYAIGFELRMPLRWNRRFYFQGGAGTDGMLAAAKGGLPDGREALDLGYAVASTDGGHQMKLLPLFAGGALFGLDPQARIDYGYNAVGRVTALAKQVLAKFYGSAPAHSYFVGCSNGGRQALVSAARFADQFDGILAGDPGFNLPKAGVQHAWDTQQFLAVSPSRPAGAFTVDELKMVSARILAKCDQRDGAADGIVDDLLGCRTAFELARDVETCAGERTGSCLTAVQKTALQNVMSGPRNSRGEALYADWPWDPGIAASAGGGGSWRAWKLEDPLLGGASFIGTLGGSALPYIFVTPPVDVARGALDIVGALQRYLATFSFDVDAPKIHQTSGPFSESAMSFMTPPNPTRLDPFAARGKLIVYHGAADPVFSVNDTIRWFEGVQADTANADGFARLFVVPGMGHCFGGVATDRFDLFSPLVAWVERDVPPASVVAKRSPANADVPPTWSANRTHLLCPFPKHAQLNPGASNLEVAESFHCE